MFSNSSEDTDLSLAAALTKNLSLFRWELTPITYHTSHVIGWNQQHVSCLFKYDWLIRTEHFLYPTGSWSFWILAAATSRRLPVWVHVQHRKCFTVFSTFCSTWFFGHTHKVIGYIHRSVNSCLCWNFSSSFSARCNGVYGNVVFHLNSSVSNSWTKKNQKLVWFTFFQVSQHEELKDRRPEETTAASSTCTGQEV